MLPPSCVPVDSFVMSLVALLPAYLPSHCSASARASRRSGIGVTENTIEIFRSLPSRRVCLASALSVSDNINVSETASTLDESRETLVKQVALDGHVAFVKWVLEHKVGIDFVHRAQRAVDIIRVGRRNHKEFHACSTRKSKQNRNTTTRTRYESRGGHANEDWCIRPNRLV